MPTNSDRPKVGPADPETRRKKLHEVLDEPTRATGVAPKPKAEKPKKELKRRFGPNGKTMDEIEDEAMSGKGESMQDAINKGIREAKESRE